jgi:hypothetical protein
MFMNISRGERIDFNQQAMPKNDIQTVGTKRSIAEQDGFHQADFFVIHADDVIGYMYVLTSLWLTPVYSV